MANRILISALATAAMAVSATAIAHPGGGPGGQPLLRQTVQNGEDRGVRELRTGGQRIVHLAYRQRGERVP